MQASPLHQHKLPGSNRLLCSVTVTAIATASCMLPTGLSRNQPDSFPLPAQSLTAQIYPKLCSSMQPWQQSQQSAPCILWLGG